MIDLRRRRECTIIKPFLNRARMIQAHTEREPIRAFIGSAEKPIAFLDQIVPFDFGLDENENPIQKTWREYAGYKVSLDGNFVLIMIATPIRYKNGRCISWGRRDMVFLKFADALGIENVNTKSEHRALINSDRYKIIE